MQNQFKITIWVLTAFWPLLGGQNCLVKTRDGTIKRLNV